MDRKQSGIIFFAIVAFILYAFGVELFERVWSFPSIRKIPLMVIALVGTGVFATAVSYTHLTLPTKRIV